MSLSSKERLRFGNFALLHQRELRLSTTTPAPFAPPPLVQSRAARITPFAPGPFAHYRALRGAPSAAWRVAVRDVLRLPQSPLRLPILDANVDDDRTPFFFTTPFVFGVPLKRVVDALAGQRGQAPAPLARALSAQLKEHVADALVHVDAGRRPRPARIDALAVTQRGKVLDFGFAPVALLRGEAAGSIDLDRVARAYGAVLSEVRACETEATALALLQSSENARDAADLAGDGDDEDALGAFVARVFADDVLAHAAIVEEHGLLSPSVLERLLVASKGR